MLGVMIGDISGSFREFTKKEKYPEYGLLPDASKMPSALLRYGITDDSVLSLATAYVCLKHNGSLSKLTSEDFSAMYHGFGNVYKDPIGGYGGGFLRWLSTNDKKPYNSCGNGSAMRVAPVAYVANSIDEVFELAFKSACATHNHPEGIKGAQATALMIYLARKGWKLPDIVESLNKSFLSYEPCEGFDHFDSLCQDTMRLVMHVLLTTDNFHDAVLKAVTIPYADSDTLGAIVGSIAEPLYGIPDDIRTKAMKFLYEPNLLSVFNDFNKIYINA